MPATTNTDITPPKTTAGKVPNSLEVTPLSNCPSSLDEFMKIMLMEDTRPRNSSGVYSCEIVPLITTLIPSQIPAAARAKKLNQ